ncbi:lipopolysaccharide core heptose(I) kinase RfaP [Alkalilimnicola ehrlichii MLHE-1]|uniref:Lipopolysaccharide core heptose(I) kinase n=1 Tax=Alkalilimnicola ehrlichii (strain ATCC BAA-1101 / DSM 17681 / MLHE-1) TaxID=187272 RepID=Q0A4V3_ALKEH|nr:lipopolysaccharide core heptose(I) kinase RfaP [Alkalilimnicola ehrlichii]ABI58134.1 lipopolysaccharide kinase [Alkalilimnicola ehrlichii MLHE-1]
MSLRRNELVLDPGFQADLRATFGPGDPFEQVMALDGEVVRAVDGRRTFRFELAGRAYFAKLHTGMPWPRILRKLSQFRVPVLGAEPEWRAIHRLQALGVATTPPVAFGVRRGLNPARERSFVITRDLGHTHTLEQECLRWPEAPPAYTFRVKLIREVARIARTLHADGMNHRDFYLCHFRLDLNDDPPAVLAGRHSPRLYLMDLHRVQRHQSLPERARVKDIGGLYFSALDIGLTRRDLLRFMRAYRGTTLRRTLAADRTFWQQVAERARWQYRREHGHGPEGLPL